MGVRRTVKVGLDTLLEVADSTIDATEADASDAALLASSSTSARVAAAARRATEARLWKRMVRQARWATARTLSLRTEGKEEVKRIANGSIGQVPDGRLHTVDELRGRHGFIFDVNLGREDKESCEVGASVSLLPPCTALWQKPLTQIGPTVSRFSNHLFLRNFLFKPLEDRLYIFIESLLMVLSCGHYA